MDPKVKKWVPAVVIVAAIALFFSLRSATADPSIPTAPAPAGTNPAYYTADEIAAANARGETLPNPPTSSPQ
ncbi:hypothetical protein EON79_17360 [bacterium]|nr:MAG: hypothetical protein EON79_17360 [bacterium]